VSITLASLTHFLMAPHPKKPRPSLIDLSRAAKVDVVITKFYHDFVGPEDDQATMATLESKVKLVKEFKDDEEVEQQVGGIISDLGCTRTHKSKFYRTLELYWHTKKMVALEMLPKDEDLLPTKASHRDSGGEKCLSSVGGVLDC